MASREYGRPPAEIPARLREAIARSALVARADLVASIAHGAIGQVRADRVTPYIDHPRRAAELLLGWSAAEIVALDDHDLDVCTAATLLHDVLEDTRLARSELKARFPEAPRMIELVEIMTEIEGDPDDPAYYRRIARDEQATIIKLADRCANLDDVIEDVRRGRGVERWRRYVQKTRRDVEPIAPAALQKELRDRMAAAQHLMDRGVAAT